MYRGIHTYIACLLTWSIACTALVPAARAQQLAHGPKLTDCTQRAVQQVLDQTLIELSPQDLAQTGIELMLTKILSVTFWEKALYGPYYGWLVIDMFAFLFFSVWSALRVQKLNNPDVVSRMKYIADENARIRLNHLIHLKNNTSPSSSEYTNIQRRIQFNEELRASDTKAFEQHIRSQSKFIFRMGLAVTVFYGVLIMVFNYWSHERKASQKSRQNSVSVTKRQLMNATSMHEMNLLLTTQAPEAQGQLKNMLAACHAFLRDADSIFEQALDTYSLD